MECLFLTKNITDDKIKVATLVTRLSTDAHALLKQLIAPEKITNTDSKFLMKRMSNLIKPKPSEAIERCTFYSAKQEPNESISDFIARLKKLALNCNLENALKDQLVCGVYDKDVKIKLFEEKTLTWANAQETATAREAAKKKAATASNTLEKKSQKYDFYAIHGGQQRKTWKGKGSNKGAKAPGGKQQKQPMGPSRQHAVPCYCCGKPNHISRECRYHEYICGKCNVKGHIARVCKSDKNSAHTYNECVKK